MAHQKYQGVTVKAVAPFSFDGEVFAKLTRPREKHIAEHHVTFGGGYAFSPKWQVSTTVEYAFNNEVMYYNPELPFGPGAEEENEYVALQLTLSCRW